MKSVSLKVLVIFLFLVLILSAGAAFSTISTAQEQAPREVLATVYEQVSPSVVAIAVEAEADSVSQIIPNNGQGNAQPSQIQRALGSGFVIDGEGHIVTNAHVVENATSIEVAFHDGTLARANVVGIDSDSDLAVIQVEDVDSAVLQPAILADSNELYVGQSVLAIGSPFGERWTLTTGVISGLNRLIQGLNGYSIAGAIQTDAAINPGNSGGPLLNMNGEVVGVNAQILSSSGVSSGIGFAISSNLVRHVSQQLIEQGFVEYSYMGIGGGDVTLDIIEALDLPNNTRGVVIGDVAEGAPADRAGLEGAVFSNDGYNDLQSADIITAIDGQELFGIADLISYLASDTQPGDTVRLTVLRDGTEEVSLEVTLVPRPRIGQG
jgi:S1-C subfamily serine protease